MGQSEDLALCVVQKERDRRQGRRTSLVYAPRIYAQIIAVVLILVGVLGCGAGGGSAGGGGGAEDAQAPSGAKESVVKSIRVKETEFALKPAEITLEKPGTYELYCPVDAHKEEGMEGKVIVKEGSGGSGGY
jgi:hypothetical protein